MHIYLIYLINSKNAYFESHITKANFLQNIIIYLILTIIPNKEAYQRSQYRIEHKSKNAWLSWGMNRNWGVYINILQFLSKSENSIC